MSGRYLTNGRSEMPSRTSRGRPDRAGWCARSGKGEDAARSIGAGGHAIRIDVTDQTSIAAAAQRIWREFGRLDILMNNAGISRAKADQPFAKAVKTNLLTDARLASLGCRKDAIHDASGSSRLGRRARRKPRAFSEPLVSCRDARSNNRARAI